MAEVNTANLIARKWTDTKGAFQGFKGWKVISWLISTQVVELFGINIWSNLKGVIKNHNWDYNSAQTGSTYFFFLGSFLGPLVYGVDFLDRRGHSLFKLRRTECILWLCVFPQDYKCVYQKVFISDIVQVRTLYAPVPMSVYVCKRWLPGGLGTCLFICLNSLIQLIPSHLSWSFMTCPKIVLGLWCCFSGIHT